MLRNKFLERSCLLRIFHLSPHILYLLSFATNIIMKIYNVFHIQKIFRTAQLQGRIWRRLWKVSRESIGEFIGKFQAKVFKSSIMLPSRDSTLLIVHFIRKLFSSNFLRRFSKS